MTERTNATTAALTITANDRSKVQGTTLSLGTTAFSTGGLVGSDGISSVTLTSAGADAGAAAGTYPIVPSNAVAASGTSLANYTVSYVNGTLTVTRGNRQRPDGDDHDGRRRARSTSSDQVVYASYKCVAVNRVAVASCVGAVRERLADRHVDGRLSTRSRSPAPTSTAARRR